jgi:hypothetical protein
MIPVNEETKKTRKPCLQVSWNVQVYDKNDKLVEEKSGQNSLLVAFATKMAGFLYDTTSTYKDITNTNRNAYQMYPGNQPNGMPCAGGGFGLTTLGIVLGTNNTAVTADDYKLNTIVAQGSGAGQLLYQAGGSTGVVTAAPLSSFIIDRVMLNHSAGTITIKELGIYSIEGGASATICLCRDIIADPGVDIDDGEYMYVRYTISVTT